MKRWILVALCGPGVALAQVAGGLSNYDGQPKPVPFTETVFGIPVNDPYRWMEKAERRDELKAWVNASSLHTTTQLARMPGYPALVRALADAGKTSDRFFSVTVAGPRTFYLKLPVDGQVMSLWVREGGKDRLLFDPAASANGTSPRTIDSYSVSPSGNLVAINIGEGGSEVGGARFYDVATGRELGQSLPSIWGEAPVAWLDNQTVLYSRIRDVKPGEDRLQRETMMLHRLGTDPVADTPLLGTDVRTGVAIAEREVPYAVTGVGSRYVLAVIGGAQASVRVAIGTVAAMRASKPDWRELAKLDDQVAEASPALVGDTFFYVTTRRDPQGEVRRLILRPDAALDASEPVLSGRGVIRTSLFTQDGAYVFVGTPHAASRLWYAPRDGAPREVKLPFIGSAFLFNTSVDRRTATFAFDGFQQATSTFRLDRGRLTSMNLDATTPPAAKSFSVDEDWATSPDGTKVPLTIIHGARHGGPQPTIIEAYGGYGVSTEPQYTPNLTVWVARGGVYAQCHTRGGGELGSAWHDGGRERNKPNAHADLIACGRRLVERGYATPATMGLFGASAAGLLVPMAAMKAPDLFAAAVTRVGLVNPIRLAVANNGANQFEENGDPATEAGFKALAAQDSTLFLPQAKGGPDFLFTIGLNDSRVDPWMSAKLVAMMRARWGDRHLALIRSDDKGGHGMNPTRDQAVAERADIFAFFLNRFGQPGFGH